MRKFAFALVWLCAACVAGGKSVYTAETLLATRSSNEFGVELYRKLAGQKGNLFFSPLSIEMALAMAQAGARGPTAEEMAAVLRLRPPAEKVHGGFADLLRELTDSQAAGCRLLIANALWGQKGYPFNAAYQDLLRKHYGAGVNEVDFERDMENARLTINRWVEKQTADRIKDLIPRGALDELTRLVLTNAVYFKGAWVHQFSESATRTEPFLSPGGRVDVPMMNHTASYNYFENGRFQLLEMPYEGRAVSMVIILPRKADGLGEIEKDLKMSDLDAWIDAARLRTVQVSVPRFRMTSQFSLADVLKSMGITRAFDAGAADFSGIATVERLAISAVIHKAWVDVNEKGTEAAAATAVAIGAAALPAEPVVFRADHPFLLLIRHVRSASTRERTAGAILFMGRLTTP